MYSRYSMYSIYFSNLSSEFSPKALNDEAHDWLCVF